MAVHEILRIYDEAVAKYVERKVTNAVLVDLEVPSLGYKEVPVHIATPDRPYGFDFPVRASDGSIDTQRSQNMLMTPQVTITRLGLTYDMQRNNTNPVRKGPFWDADKKFRIRSEYPKPWLIDYQIDVHARSRNDIQAAIQHWLYYISPTRVLRIDFLYPWDKVRLIMNFSQIVDNSDLETQEDLRFYRYTIPFNVEAYMFQVLDGPADVPAYSTNPDAFTSRWRTVHDYKIQVWEESSNTMFYEVTFDGTGGEFA